MFENRQYTIAVPMHKYDRIPDRPAAVTDVWTWNGGSRVDMEADLTGEPVTRVHVHRDDGTVVFHQPASTIPCQLSDPTRDYLANLYSRLESASLAATSAAFDAISEDLINQLAPPNENLPQAFNELADITAAATP